MSCRQICCWAALEEERGSKEQAMQQDATMLDVLARKMTNVLYGVSTHVKVLQDREPEANILIASAAKARKLDGEQPVQYEFKWIIARRAVVVLMSDTLLCGDWEISLTSVQHASLLRAKTLFMKGLILKITTNEGQHYQFGMQYDPAWENQTVLLLSVEDYQLQYSVFSIIFRVVIIIWIIWLIIQWVT